MQEKLIACAAKYGFRARPLGDKVNVFARNMDGCWVIWITYDFQKNLVSCKGNTDQLNIWLGTTRSDITPEKCLSFVSELNEALQLTGDNRFMVKELIDPEDWQEIANVNDAYQDVRHIQN